MELPSNLDFNAYSGNAYGGLLQEKEVDIKARYAQERMR
jgi:hypothetical protein